MNSPKIFFFKSLKTKSVIRSIVKRVEVRTLLFFAGVSQSAFPLLVVERMVLAFFPPVTLVTLHHLVTSSFFILVLVVDLAPVLAFILVIKGLQRASSVVLHIMCVNATCLIMA